MRMTALRTTPIRTLESTQSLWVESLSALAPWRVTITQLTNGLVHMNRRTVFVASASIVVLVAASFLSGFVLRSADRAIGTSPAAAEHIAFANPTAADRGLSPNDTVVIDIYCASGGPLSVSTTYEKLGVATASDSTVVQCSPGESTYATVTLAGARPDSWAYFSLSGVSQPLKALVI